MGRRTYSPSSSSSESDKNEQGSPFSFEAESTAQHQETASVEQIPQKTQAVEADLPLAQRMLQEKSLAEEQEINFQLLRELKERENQNSLLLQQLELSEIQQQLQQFEVSRLSRKSAELQKRAIFEACQRQNIESNARQTYRNPAKLMNFLKAQKAKDSKPFKSNAEYLSHIQAFAAVSNNLSHTEREQKRLALSRYTAQQRLNGHRTSIALDETVLPHASPPGRDCCAGHSPKAEVPV